VIDDADVRLKNPPLLSVMRIEQKIARDHSAGRRKKYHERQA
jgi:hypothetical protein